MSADRFRQRLSSMKYPKLRSLAKKHGMKANQKSEKLIVALANYFTSGGGRDSSSSVSYSDSEERHARKSPRTSTPLARRKTLHTFQLRPDQHQMEKENDDSEQNLSESSLHLQLAEPRSPPMRKPNRRSTPRIPRESNRGNSVYEDGELVERNSGTYTVESMSTGDSSGHRQAEGNQTGNDVVQGVGCGNDSVQGSGSDDGEEIVDDCGGKEETSSDERRSIWKEIDRRVKETEAKRTEKAQEDQGKSPVQKKLFCDEYFGSKSSQSKTPGKNFQEAHEREFAKMEGIDGYMERRRVRHQQLTGTVSERIQKLATPTNKAEKFAQRQACRKTQASKTPGLKFGAPKIIKPVARKTVGASGYSGAEIIGVKPAIAGFKVESPRTPGKTGFKFGENSPSGFKFGWKGQKFQKTPSKLSATKSVFKVGGVRKEEGSRSRSFRSTKKNKEAMQNETEEVELNRTFEYSPSKEEKMGGEVVEKQTVQNTLTAPPSSTVTRSRAAGVMKTEMPKQPSHKSTAPSIKASGKMRIEKTTKKILAEKAPKRENTRQGGYKPHRGPLKPFIDTRMMTAEKAKVVHSASPTTLAAMFPKEFSRVARRREVKGRRAEAKESLLMKKRGINFRKK